MRLAFWKLLAGVLAAALVAGCSKSSAGDKGGNGGTNGTSSSNNWDSMVWDQGKWQ